MKTNAIPVAVAMSTLFNMVASHGAMITPAPRSVSAVADPRSHLVTLPSTLSFHPLFRVEQADEGRYPSR